MFESLMSLSRAGYANPEWNDSEFGTSEQLAVLARSLSTQPLRTTETGLPNIPEVEVVRHFTRMSTLSHGVDTGSYPLGSCTMKYNPKRSDTFAALPGFANIHPSQPIETVQGSCEILHTLSQYICELTGMDAVTLQPAAGAHGEFTGLLMIRAYFESRKDQRNIILIPDSAHGTNPASASMAGFKCKLIPTTAEGLVDVDALRAELSPQVAAIMLTNPSTLGLFEERIVEVADLVHANGSLLYYDGANLNALMGIVRPGDMGFDVIHINVHKTLGTPHGGGGPGAGPVGVKKILEPFLPIPFLRHEGDRFIWDEDRPQSIGRMKSHFGHFAVLVRALSFILSSGGEGLRRASENAVLNANYLQERLRAYLPPVFDKLCMHECLLSAEKLQVNAFDFAKRLIDYGVHPPTLVGAGCVYFPGDLKSAMLIEPTETETVDRLDHLIDAFIRVVQETATHPELVMSAPHSKPTARIKSDASC